MKSPLRLPAGKHEQRTARYRNQAGAPGKEAPEKAGEHPAARERAGQDIHGCGDEEVEGAGEVSRGVT